jgi:Fic family protein
MPYHPEFTIRASLLSKVECIAALREQIRAAAVDLAWIPALQKDSRSRNVHASTAIEGNPLTLEQVRALEKGRGLSASSPRSEREVLNYFAGLRYIEQRAGIERIHHDDIFELHRILADGVMDQGQAGRYRTIQVRVGQYTPPPAQDVSSLMMEMMDWWNGPASELSPVLSSAILHYRFEEIHPFADGNGRTGRALSLWDLYRRGFDTHHIFAVDEYYWEDRPSYYQSLARVRSEGGDLSGWLEYCADGYQQTLERAWLRLQTLGIAGRRKLMIKPRQEQLLLLLRDHGKMAPAEIWEALGVSRQGAMDTINPLLEAGIIEKVGSRKTGRYRLVETDSY